jgi:hypothetical protein
MIHLHHVNLGVTVGGIDAEAKFLIETLGYNRMDITPELAALGACWFRSRRKIARGIDGR